MIMTEQDIEYLLKNNRWIAVYPTHDMRRRHPERWKAYIYKKTKKNTWITEFSTKKKTPKECYDWIESRFSDIKNLKE